MYIDCVWETIGFAIMCLTLIPLTLIVLFTTTPTFANSVDPDQMASEEAI